MTTISSPRFVPILEDPSRPHNVYCITNLVNGKIYVGYTGDMIYMRLNAHVTDARNQSNMTIHKAIRKHGHENFKIELVSNWATAEDALTDEVRLIAEWKTQNKEIGYNTSGGGEGNLITTPEYRKKKSESVIAAYKADPTIKERIAETLRNGASSLIGKQRTKSEKEIISRTHRKTYILQTPSDELIQVDCLAKFCKDKGLNYHVLRACFKKNLKTSPKSNGWKIVANLGYTKNLKCVISPPQ